LQIELEVSIERRPSSSARRCRRWSTTWPRTACSRRRTLPSPPRPAG